MEEQRVVPISGPALPPAPAKPDKPKARIVARKAWPGETQQQLAFGPIVSVSRGPATEIESDIHTGARVAATQHRALAAFVDGGIMLFAYVILAGMYVFWGNGRLTGDPVTLGVGGILALLVVLLYQTLWALGNGDSAGMRFARLKLVNFDGRRPKRRERFCRMASAWLSVAPAGLGLVWALLDEEALTWHDQISKTFPSPLDALKSAS